MPTELTRVMVTIEKPELLEWIDAEAQARDRSRSWMLQEAARQWQLRLEGQRARRRSRLTLG